MMYFLLNIQIRITHQAFIYFTCAFTSLSDRFDNQRLSCVHIARCKDIFHVCFKTILLCLHIGSWRQFHLKSIRDVFLCPQEARSNEYKLAVHDFFTACYFFTIHSACLRILFPCKFYDLNRFQPAVFIFDELLYRGFINTWVMPEYSDRLLLTVICLADLRPFLATDCLPHVCPVP